MRGGWPRNRPKTSDGFHASLMPVWKAHVGIQTLLLAPLRILMAVCFIVFLIVGANVANLQLARATRAPQRTERAHGPGGGSVAAGAAASHREPVAGGDGRGWRAIALASWLGRSLLWMLPPIGFPIEFDFSLNADVLVFTVLLCCASSLLTGLAPALQAVKSSLIEALKEGGRCGSPGAGQNRTRGLLVVSEVALALVALVGTALFARSFQNARAIQPGFDAGNVVYAQYHLDTLLSEPGAARAVLLPPARPASGRSPALPR